MFLSFFWSLLIDVTFSSFFVVVVVVVRFPAVVDWFMELKERVAILLTCERSDAPCSMLREVM